MKMAVHSDKHQTAFCSLLEFLYNIHEPVEMNHQEMKNSNYKEQDKPKRKIYRHFNLKPQTADRWNIPLINPSAPLWLT